MSIRLTIATATLNAKSSGRGESLLRAVASVRAIGVPHEHLVVDGGSLDGSVELLAGSGATVMSERDSGIYEALNRALFVARGEWFYVLGDDDEIVDTDALEYAIALGERKGADMVASPLLTSEGWMVRARPQNVLGGMAYPHQGLLVRTSALRALGGFDTRYRIAGDYDSCLRLHLSGAKCVVGHRYFARFSCGGLSRDLAEANRETVAVITDRLGLDAAETEFVRRYRVLPFARAWSLLTHSDAVIRRAAVHQLVKRLALSLGLIKHSSTR